MPEHILVHFGRSDGDRSEDTVMLEEMRSFDWAGTSAGAIEGWPEPLKHAARLMLLSAAPMTVLIGREGFVTYNDSVRDVFGRHYDGVLGRPIGEVFPEAAAFHRKAIDQCFDGKGMRFRDEPIRLYRNGEWSTARFHLAFTPITDEQGAVFGVLLIASETTDRVRALRDLRRAQERMDIALDAGGIVGTWDLDVATHRLTSDERFARLFGINPNDAIAGFDNKILVKVVHPDDRALVAAALDGAVRTGSDYKCRYRVITKSGTRWYFDAGRAVLDADGHTVRLCGVVIDLTDQVATAEALAESEMRFEAVAESIPQIVWSTDADGRHDYFNRRWNEFTGLDAREIAADTWTRLVHPDDWVNVSETWQECLATGKTYDIEYRFLHHSGDYRWLRVMALPLHDRGGRVTRWYGTSTDIEDAKLLETERELVANELDHRIRNLFALVNGLVTLSVRDEPGMAPLAEALKQRLDALHIAHGFIHSRNTDPSDTTRSLQTLVSTLLKPYDDECARIQLSGDDARISQGMVTPLALVFHELATNSAKYGAFGDPLGVLEVTFTRDDGQLQIDWKETGETANIPHSEKGGFGSRLLTLTIERQLRGSFSRTWNGTGMTFHLAIPLGSGA